MLVFKRTLSICHLFDVFFVFDTLDVLLNSKELLTLLDADPQKAANDSAASTLRGFIYQAVGQMAQKVPSVFSCDPKIAERMFLSLPGEPAGVRAQVQEAISVMATSYKESGFSERDEIESLLVRSFESSEVH